MSDSGDYRSWLKYAAENRKVAALSLESLLFNACLQNAQQAVEKALKAICLSRGQAIKRTHCISELVGDLAALGLDVGLTDDDVELLDSIYLPSKYPPDAALAGGEPGEAVCRRCLEIADRALHQAMKLAEPNSGE